MKIIYGKKLSNGFINKTITIAKMLGIDINDLIACMAFETGETFSAKVKNKFSNAVGLIQFMPFTCAYLLGASPTAIRLMTRADLAYYTHQFEIMSEIEQLDHVYKYFVPHKNKLKSLEDVYMAILYPIAIGKSNSYVLFRQDSPNPKQYLQNKGLDYNKDGVITKGEAATLVRNKYNRGLNFARDI